MSRKTVKVIANVSLESAQEASAQYTSKATRLAKIEAKLNERINKVKDEYQDEVNVLTSELDSHFAVLEVFAKEQKETWGKKKSLELLHTVIGFRTGNPTVTKPKKFTWDSIITLVKEKFPTLVRTGADELNKEAIIALRDQEEFKTLKESCYVDVTQSESFYVTAKAEDLQPA